MALAASQRRCRAGTQRYGCCVGPESYCLFFDFDEPQGQGSCPGASLCLRKPKARAAPGSALAQPPLTLNARPPFALSPPRRAAQGCGKLGGPCCPQESSVQRALTCDDPGALCVGGGGLNTTYEAYLELSADPGSLVQAGSFGTCMTGEAPPPAGGRR
jgi:hypothetical protein